MPQTAGKPAKKSSKTKSSSTSKRHFTVVIGSKEHGLYCSSSPSSAARKAVSKLCGKEKGKKVEFCLREITQGSKKKTYGPYLGHIEKLAKPIELKGRVIERKPVALLKPKSSAKKGGMRGGTLEEDFTGDFDTAILQKPNTYNKSNERLTINDVSKKYIDLGLTADRQKEILNAQFKNKVSELEVGATNNLRSLRAKYRYMGIQDITDNEAVNLIFNRQRRKN